MPFKHIAFRTDANNRIGTGHFMRCLTLANVLKKHGTHIRFVSRGLPQHFRTMLSANDMELASLDSNGSSFVTGDLPHAHWLETSQEKDAMATVHALSDEHWDWLIVDHYALDVRWEFMLRQTARKIMVIDDIADRQHDCDLLLDQNFSEEMNIRYLGKVPSHCQLLLGPHYALLRDEFRKLREQVKPRSGLVKRVMVFFGGIDSENYTSCAIEALSEIEIPALHVDVVVGTQHPFLQKIKDECTHNKFSCHIQTDKMAELMAKADLAIGAGGATIWERCCLGLPTLVLSTANNQQKQVTEAALAGLVYSPEQEGNTAQIISRHIQALLENNSLRQLISHSALKAVDGLGTSRIIELIGSDHITLRNAEADDSENLFKWRNHHETRKWSLQRNIIEWQDHQKWFSSILSEENKILLIGESENVTVGVVRFDIQGEEAVVSIYLVPEKVSSGLGRKLLRVAEQWLVVNHSEINKLLAHVMGENIRSHRLFSGAGYNIESSEYSKRLN